MITFKNKSAPVRSDYYHRRAERNYPTIPAQDGLIVTQSSNFFIQSKSICPCDGGCPRCLSAQAKLKIGQPNDPYEQEADRVADEVMRMEEPECAECEEEDSIVQTQPISTQITPLIQREEISPDEEEEDLFEQEEEELLQPKQLGTGSGQINPSLGSQIQSIRGQGQPLPQTARRYFEPRFGTDFSSVHVHTGSEAANLSKSLDARAFTLGRDIIFGVGQYHPYTKEGQKLLAHELTHVVQQGNTEQSARKGNLKLTESPNQKIMRERGSGTRGRERPYVSYVTIYLTSNKIDFHTSIGLYRYELEQRGLNTGEFASQVRITGNDVNFTLEGMTGEFEFSYSIGPGQTNPTTFFRGQSSVVFVITNERAPVLQTRPEQTRDPNTVYLGIVEAMRRCQENNLPGIKVFPYRGTRFGGAPIMAHRDGQDIMVRLPLYVRSNRDFHEQTRTLPLDTFIGGVRLHPNEIVRVHTYEPRWYHLNITGSTSGDIEHEYCVTGEQMLEIAEMSTRQTYINMGLTVVDAVLFFIPVGRIAQIIARPIVRIGGRTIRNLALAIMLGMSDAAPTAFAGIASRAPIVLVEGQAVRQVASRTVSQTTNHVVIRFSEQAAVRTGTEVGAVTAGQVATHPIRTATQRTVQVTVVNSAGTSITSSFTVPTGDAVLDAQLEASFRQTFDQAVPSPAARVPGQGVVSVAPEIAAGFTRQHVIGFRRFLARPFSHSDIRVLQTVWNEAANPQHQAILTLSNSRRLFNLHRGRFWRRVRNNPEARRIFEDAGCVFTGRNTTAPYYVLNGRRIRMTIDHIIERQSAPQLALTASNLRISFTRENTVVLRLLNQMDPFQ